MSIEYLKAWVLKKIDVKGDKINEYVISLRYTLTKEKPPCISIIYSRERSALMSAKVSLALAT